MPDIHLQFAGDPSVEQFSGWSGFNTSIVGFAVYVWLRSLECLADLRPIVWEGFLSSSIALRLAPKV